MLKDLLSWVFVYCFFARKIKKNRGGFHHSHLLPFHRVAYPYLYQHYDDYVDLLLRLSLGGLEMHLASYPHDEQITNATAHGICHIHRRVVYS